ncbi:hypothetical protein E1B28_011881 [Marasmius oreades]|uniref:Uncharacterized protein n=1 Tax=Marasmius oreades TaxID=181124 RepID=A0A9P7RWG7_9AGAR|nr:uncharacterized protein E1B28_011881 [Marasmius oreades]KAG7090283.1 hypothetical protein E1B28_011881 [Marasmius oreades]
MDSSFLSGFSDSSTTPLLEYSGNGALGVYVEGVGNSSRPDNDIMSMFKTDGFSDFELDLTCLSNPPSPLIEPTTPITSSEHVGALELMSLPPVIPKRSPSMKSLSFFSSQPSKIDPPPSPKTTVTPIDTLRNSGSSNGPWPLVKYVGRGTPIDPTRRIEWNRPPGAGADSAANEHGVLFNTSGGPGGRSHSLDSAVRSSQEWQRSIAPSHSHTISSCAGPRSLSPLLQLSLDTSPLEVLPESSKLQIKGIESDPDEWTSVMDTVMKSSGVTATTASGSGGERERDDGYHKQLPSPPDSKVHEPKQGSGPSARVTVTSQSQSHSSSTHDFGIFGLETAVDLGLGLGNGMNFFNLGLAPGTSMTRTLSGGHHRRASTTGGRDTPSVYSTAPPTPQEQTPSPPASVTIKDDKKSGKGGQEREVQRDLIDDYEVEGSTAGMDSPGTSSGKFIQDHHRAQWWKKLFAQLRKLQMMLRVHQHHTAGK